MDCSAEYIKMCERAEEIQIEKYRQGFIEGDFLWNGEKVCICGMDWLQVKNFFQKTKQPYFAFALMEEPEVVFRQDYPADTVKIKQGKYILKEFGGIGLWLPRQDQLQEMVKGKWGVFEIIYFKNGKFNLLDMYQNNIFRKSNILSMEQLWLAFVMSELYQKQWEDGEWKKK